jgi:hypothetical protein
VDLRSSGKAFGHDLVLVEQGDRIVRSSDDSEGTPDGRWTAKSDLCWTTENSGDQATDVAAVPRVGRAAVPSIDDHVPLGHNLPPVPSLPPADRGEFSPDPVE